MIDGLVLSGGSATFVSPEYYHELGMALGVTPDALAEALARTPQARAAFIVSPTYYGMAADVAGCVEVAHAAGVPLVVDCAWGAHFGFHESLPRSPLQLGADAMLASTHKIVGSMTQSAMLHVADTGRVDIDALARAVRLVRSTSPSALLMASLDAARRQLAVHGEALLDRTIHAAAQARVAIDEIPGCRVVGEDLVGQPGIAGWDPLRIVIDVRGTGCTGYEVAAALRASYDIYAELATHATLVLVLGLGQPLEALERLAHDFGETVRRIARDRRNAADLAPAVGARPRDGDLTARRVPRRQRGGRRRRRGRPDLVRVDRGLPAGRADAAARRTRQRGGGRVPARADRRWGPAARCGRPDVPTVRACDAP